MPWPVAILILLAFCTFIHIYFALASGITGIIQKRIPLSPLGFLLTLASVQCLAESFWPSIFPWNMGYPFFWAKIPIYQWADTIGFQGLSFLVYLFNAGIAYLWIVKDRRLTLLAGSAMALFFGVLCLSGLAKQKSWQETDTIVQTLVVQGNIGNLEKLYAEKGRGYQSIIANEYFDLTKTALTDFPNTDLIIWPESAFPVFLDFYKSSNSLVSQFLDFTKSIKKPILVGAYSKDPPEISPRKEYNALFLFDELGQAIAQPYRKTYLLIFGETLPLVDKFPWLAKYNPGGTGFGKGSGPIALPFRDIKIGPQICYESLYPEFSAKLAQLGVDLMVNLTNDSWFGSTFEPRQHMIMTLARAVEVRRPLVRSTNTGFSAAVLADGTILERGPLFQKWAGLFAIKLKKQATQTFFAQFGDWLSMAIFVFLVIVLLTLRRPRERN